MEHLGNFLIVAIIVIGLALFLWRKSRQQKATLSAPEQVLSQKELAHQAFTQGNSLLMQGKFAQATTVFQQVLALDPKHPHVSGRLAEVTRRRQEAEAITSASSSL